jgi:F-type H+-transporting ATPase subunit delta
MTAFAVQYARALADVVLESKLAPSEVNRQIEDFQRTLAGSRELREVLLNRAFSAKQRIAVMDAVNVRLQLEPKVRNFLAVLIEHGRLAALSEILEQYKTEMNRRLGIAEAEVVTARKLEAGEREEMEKQVASLAGGKVRATFREDASLIGGATVRMGSTVYDGSVRGRLERLRERLAAD